MSISDDDADYDDPAVKAKWARQQRAAVIEYFLGEGVSHGDIPHSPDFCIAPYVSVWRVLNSEDPDDVGFWAIAGDLPTDYVSSNDARDAREVLRHFAQNWHEVAQCMERREPHPDIEIGSPEEWPELAPLLESRAQALQAMADDDDLWE